MEMIGDLKYLTAIAFMFWACGDSTTSTEGFLPDTDRSTELPGNSSADIATSSTEDSVASSVTTASSASVPPSTTIESSTTVAKDSTHKSSSSDITESSTSEPDGQSSSSFSQLREYIKDTSRTTIFRFLYPVAEGALDTGYFSGGECLIDTNGTFLCKQGQCWADVGGVISLPMSFGMMSITATEKDNPSYSEYFHQSTEYTRLVDINFGDSALTTYIPYANISGFDTEDAQKRLSVLPAMPCATLEHFAGNYRLTAEGLPEGIILYHDGENIGTFGEDPSTEPYVKIAPKEEVNTMSPRVPEVNAYGLLRDFPDDCESERRYAGNKDYEYKDLEFKASVNEYGCAVLSATYNKEHFAGRCEGWTIPEKAKEYSARLINISDKVPAEPFRWKLTYKDQFGRGGTLDITTTFQ